MLFYALPTACPTPIIKQNYTPKLYRKENRCDKTFPVGRWNVIGLVLRSTKRIANVSVHHRAREEGRSGYTISKLLNLWMNGFTSFSVKPLRLATYAGTVFAGFGFLYLIYIIIDHFVRGAAPMGWASTTALLLLLGGMILLVLGLIGEYVGRIYMCANAAPQYVAREYIKHE